jgi:hypothetical protein
VKRCGEYLEMVSAFADGETPDGAAQTLELKAHMSRCAACASLLEFYRLVSETQSEAISVCEAPEELLRRVMDGVASLPPPAQIVRAPSRTAPVRTAPAARTGFGARRTGARGARRHMRLLPVVCFIMMLIALRVTGGRQDEAGPYTPVIRKREYTLTRPPGMSGEAAPGSGREDSEAMPSTSEIQADDGGGYSGFGGDEDVRWGAGASAPAQDALGGTEAEAGTVSEADAGVLIEAEDEPEGAGEPYAIIRVSGATPDVLLGKPREVLESGGYAVRVSRAEADAMIGESGFEVELSGSDTDFALVIYTP